MIPVSGGHISILGIYALDVPANAVCDMSTKDSQDGYAASAWDAPCTATTSNVTIHATLKWSHNRVWVDFSPSLRFVPSKTVTLSTDLMAPVVRFYAAGNGRDGSNGLSSKWNILFARSIDSIPVDDSKADVSVRTKIDFRTGKIERRIKHFTGYNATAGVECVVRVEDPFCVDNGSVTHP